MCIEVYITWQKELNFQLSLTCIWYIFPSKHLLWYTSLKTFGMYSRCGRNWCTTWHPTISHYKMKDKKIIMLSQLQTDVKQMVYNTDGITEGALWKHYHCRQSAKSHPTWHLKHSCCSYLSVTGSLEVKPFCFSGTSRIILVLLYSNFQ